jgi:hypothetical protein
MPKQPSECRVSWKQVAAFRLRRHYLTDDTSPGLVELCGGVCGIQAQIMSAACFSCCVRNPELTPQDVHNALWRRRSLVKTSAMRQTLHLLPASDFSVYIHALKAGRLAAIQRGASRFGVTASDLRRINETAVAALEAGPLTQRALNEQLRRGAGKKMRAWMDAFFSPLRYAVVEGLICYGPDRGREPTYLRVDQWLPKAREMDEARARTILLGRFLRAYAPATPHDFAHWSGLSMKEAKQTWDLSARKLSPVSVDGHSAFVLGDDLEFLQEKVMDGPNIRLLPYFDVYLLAHAGKDHLIDPRYYKRVYRNQAWISPVVLLDGRIAGVWSFARTGKKTVFKAELFEKLSKALRENMEEEGARLAGLQTATGW